ncbi:hypothetical protein [Stenotrophomonas indicatrix]|uniref:hypothetical protein n=1 Tax=Stenotrophomonas indicatrix TaxID=2045451 RepID=UPI0008CF4558|nr:hypothetical protein [Stenotrophomonas indicatrix]SEU13069.1 hypothetical protein SAMN05720615_11856 [Stenotrophomonas indicatrix]
MSNDKTPGDSVRYEWLSASEQWKACDHSEAQKLSAAGYEVREVRSFRMDCTCPSGDGSLRHPCPAHPATLATAKHGGCVQLGDGRSLAEHITDHLCHHEYDIGGRAELLACVVEAIASDARDRFETWARRNGYTLTRAADGEYCFISTRNLWNEYQAALSAQPSPGGQGDALTEQQIFDRFGFLEGLVTEATYRRIADEAIRIQQRALAARQPVGKIVAWQHCGENHEHMVISDSTKKALKEGETEKGIRKIDAAYSIPLARQPVGEPVAVCTTCRGSGYVDDGEIDCYPDGTPYLCGPVKCVKDCPTCSAPTAQAVDLAENMLSVLIEEGVLARNGRVFQKLRALIDSQAVGNG